MEAKAEQAKKSQEESAAKVRERVNDAAVKTAEAEAAAKAAKDAATASSGELMARSYWHGWLPGHPQQVWEVGHHQGG